MAVYPRGARLVEETEEYKSGAVSKWCTGCYRTLPLRNFTTMSYRGNRRLISWCRECVKIKMRPKEKADRVLVNRQGMLHTRKAKGEKNGIPKKETEHS